MSIIPTHVKNRHFLAADVVTLLTATLVSFLVRFEDLSWISEHWRLVSLYIGLTLPLRLIAFYAAGMYRRLWRHASVGELRQIMFAGLVSAAIGAVIGLVLLPASGLTRARAVLGRFYRRDAHGSCARSPKADSANSQNEPSPPQI